MRARNVGLALLMMGTAGAARAEVSRFEVLAREQPALGGRVFGAAGVAEKITARATIALDPADLHNAVIKDLELAPRDARGRVEATTDVVILRPAHPNGTLLFDVVNRGRKLVTSFVEDADGAAGIRLAGAADAGDGFLLGQGFTLVWAGWQADAPTGQDLLRIAVPVVAGVTGPSREEFVLDGKPGLKRVALAYPAADPANARMAMRASADAAAQVPAGLGFRFIDPSTVEITAPEGTPANALVDFSYTARDPRVMGMGLAAIRDVTAFLRRDGSDANPLASNGRSAVARAIGFGVSQSGRVLRDALYYGMNEDELGRIVFEGMMPVIPGARRSFTNARFAQPGRNPGPQFDRLYPVLRFPFTYPVLDDAVSGRRDGILLRCALSNTCPHVIQVDSEFEFWGSQASLMTSDTAGNPIDMPDNVRLFMLAGTPHANTWNAVATRRADCAMPLNPNNGAASLRALLVAMQRWIADGVTPPSSRYPSRAQGTLVSARSAYPAIPALGYRAQYARAQWIEQTEGGPEARGEYPLFVPRAGLDGNAIAGIRLPIVAAPRATYTGWNPVVGAAGAQDLCTQMGGVVPLPTHATPGDPRPALDALYPTPDAYVGAVGAVTDELVASRLMLPADAEAASHAAREGTLAKLGGMVE